MKRVIIDWEEVYPDYSIYDADSNERPAGLTEERHDYVFEISDETYRRWKEAETKYMRMQNETEALVEQKRRELHPPKTAGLQSRERKIYKKKGE